MLRRSLRYRRFVLLVSGSLSAVSLLAPNVHAQESDPVVKEGEQKPASKKAERIQVTGSRIKRTEAEGVSSVIQVDREAIEKSGVASVGELLQNMAVSSEGSYTSSTVSDTRGTVTSVNLRGLGAENTLVLLDGRRLPDEGGGGVVDLSTIPMAAIERIEILKDSASAIYGSDATGGVVNIITKKDFDGSAFYARGSNPNGKGGDQAVFSYVTGVTKDNFRSLTALSYRHTEPVFYRDRDWTREGLSLYSFPGNVSGAGIKLQAHPNCPPGAPRLTEDGLENCAYNYGATSAFSPETTEVSILNNFEYQINSKIGLFSSIRAVHNTNEWNMAPNAGKFTIPAAVAAAKREELKLAQLGLTGEITGDVDAYYRGLPWGLRTWKEENTVIGGNIGLKGELIGSWEWNASAGRSDSKKDSINPTGFMLKNTLVNAVSAGEFNPFETDLNNPALADVVSRASYQPFVITETQMLTYDANTTGQLFDLPGGAAGLALGVNRTEQTYKKTIDQQSQNDNVFGVTNDQDDSGDRQVNAAFAEINLPVAKSLELQVAVRHDQYSDFGSTTNPKFGFKFLPVSGLLLRGNVATGFKAPTLREIHKGKTVALDDLNDRLLYGQGDDIPLTTEVEIESEGNKDLQEETSLSYNFGFVTDPVENVTLSADYWYLKINDIITDMKPQDVVDSLSRGEEFDGVTVKRAGDQPTGRLERIKIPTLNLGESEDSGYDITGEYRIPAGTNRFTIGSEYSRKIYSKLVPFPGLAQRNVLGDRGKPAWRMVNSGTWAFGSQAVLVRGNVIAKQRSDSDPNLNIGSFTTYDMQYAWNHPWNGSVAVGALNVFDTDFPVDNSARDGDGTRVQELFSPDGRVVYVNLNQTF